MALLKLFKSRYTPEQKVQLDRFVEQWNDIYTQHYAGFTAMASQLAELHQACKHALSSGMDRLAIMDTEALAQARVSLEARQASIDQTLDVLRRIELQDWYPNKLKNLYKERIKFLDAERAYLDMPLRALAMPAPLRDTPGHNKLNMFYSGLNLSATMSGAIRTRIKA